MATMVSVNCETGEVEERDLSPTEVAEFGTEEQALAASWVELRADRDAMLAQTDWIGLPDVQLTDERRQALLTYRQALRDVPQTNDDPFNPDWPEPPAT